MRAGYTRGRNDLLTFFFFPSPIGQSFLRWSGQVYAPRLQLLRRTIGCLKRRTSFGNDACILTSCFDSGLSFSIVAPYSKQCSQLSMKHTMNLHAHLPPPRSTLSSPGPLQLAHPRLECLASAAAEAQHHRHRIGRSSCPSKGYFVVASRCQSTFRQSSQEAPPKPPSR